MTRTNIWYFFGGGIGAFLHVLHTVDRLWQALPQETRGHSYIVLTGSPAIYEELAILYPHIQVLHFHSKNVKCVLSVFFREFFHRNVIFFSPSFGEHSLRMRLYARFLAFFPGSRVIGFARSSFLNRMLFSKRFVRPKNESIFSFVISVGAQTISDAKPDAPDILFSYDVALAKRLFEPYLIVHPFPASPMRTLPEKRWVDLLSYIRHAHPRLTIILSGSEHDRPAYEAMMLGCGFQLPYLLDFAEGDLMREIQIIAGATLFIGIDTGITHLASVLRVHSLVIGNNSNPIWLPTYNSNATILVNNEHCTCDGAKGGNCVAYEDGKPYYRCMLEIPQEEIYIAVEKMLATI